MEDAGLRLATIIMRTSALRGAFTRALLFSVSIGVSRNCQIVSFVSFAAKCRDEYVTTRCRHSLNGIRGENTITITFYYIFHKETDSLSAQISAYRV